MTRFWQAEQGLEFRLFKFNRLKEDIALDRLYQPLSDIDRVYAAIRFYTFAHGMIWSNSFLTKYLIN